MDPHYFVQTIEAISLIAVGLLYVSAIYIGFRHLLPRLSPGARHFAIGILVLQITVRVLALTVPATSAYDQWLWDMSGVAEWNIPSHFETTQLAIVAGVALLAAWLAREHPLWSRLHLIMIGLVVAVFLLDEHLRIHEAVSDVRYIHILLGAILTATTLYVAARAPRRYRVWHFALLAGLAISGFGALVLDMRYSLCVKLGIPDHCPYLAHLEETMELLGIWLAMVAVLGLLNIIVPALSQSVRCALYSLPAMWLLLMLAYALYPQLEFRLLADSAALEFESGIHLRGYRLQVSGDEAHVALYASSRQSDYLGLGYSISLVDQVSGQSIANRDEWADRSRSLWFLGREYAPLYRQPMTVAVPDTAAANRAFWIVLTLWRKHWDGSFPKQAVLASDHRLLSETQVILGEMVKPALSAGASGASLAVFDHGITLGEAALPQSARLGDTLNIQFSWRADAAGADDFIQFLHFGHVESGKWLVYDQQPLGPRLPTRLWYSGLSDREMWAVPLPAELAPGIYTVYTGLYRLSDQKRVAVTDAGGVPYDDARVPLGTLTID